MPIKEPWGLDTGLLTFKVGKAEALNVSAVEEDGNSTFHKTTLHLTGALPAIAGGANLGVSRKLYTFPHGTIRILTAAFIDVAIQQTEGNIDDDTPDVGLGTAAATGAVATLTTAAWEDILTGQTFTDCDGTEELVGVASTLVKVKGDNPDAVYFNVADEWAASGDTGALISGQVVITWELISE